MYRANRYGSLPLVPYDDIGERVAASLYAPAAEEDVEEEAFGIIPLLIMGASAAIAASPKAQAKMKELFTKKKSADGQSKKKGGKESPKRAKSGTTKTRPKGDDRELSDSGSDSSDDLDDLEREVEGEPKDDLDALEHDVSESFGEDDDVYEEIGRKVSRQMFGGY